MELIRYIHNLRKHHQGCVATIGNFDGVHLGHQAVIEQLQGHAERMSLPAVVMTFEPQALEYFSPESAPSRLSSLREKCELFEYKGVDRVFCLRFQRSLCELPAESFIEDILVKGLGVKYVIVGDDFRFGKGREGNFSMLKELGQHFGFEVVSTQTFVVDGERVSSSRVREVLARNDLQQAEKLLGRAYSISGRVRHGQKRGRELGYPTANIGFGKRKPPVLGIYAVRVHGLDETIYNGVASIGTRPVFNGKAVLLETHLLNFDDDIYGKHIKVEFLQYIRSEQMFDSVEELKEQIEQDRLTAIDFFKNSGLM